MHYTGPTRKNDLLRINQIRHKSKVKCTYSIHEKSLLFRENGTIPNFHPVFHKHETYFANATLAQTGWRSIFLDERL